MRTCVLILFPFVWILVAMLSVESMVRGYHVYKDDWSPSVGDELKLELEELKRHDRYAVAIKVSGNIVNNAPRKFSKIVYHFIKNGGRVAGEVRGKRQRSAIHMKELEIPCLYKSDSPSPSKAKKPAVVLNNFFFQLHLHSPYFYEFRQIFYY